ncbi:MAG: hypothetical protein Q7R22_012110 [Verrucomicrobiota bacterium JB025]|nr:hypothetical protein [Verrucomicrobiota bacterium JB025]
MILRTLILCSLALPALGQELSDPWTALAVPWYPDELATNHYRNSGDAAKITARRKATPAKISLEGVQVKLPQAISTAVCDETGQNLILVERDTATLRHLDLKTGKFLPDSIQLKETPSQIHVSGPWRLHVHEKSNRLELHQADKPGQSPSWTAPAGEAILAVGIAAKQPAAPLLILCRYTPPTPTKPKPVPYRLHCLHSSSLKPTKWKLNEESDLAKVCAGLRFVRRQSGTFLIPVDDDGRSAHFGPYDLAFKAGHLIEAVETKCPQITADRAYGFHRLHHGRWIRTQGRGDLRSAEGSDLLPTKLLERYSLTSSDELLIAGGMEILPHNPGQKDFRKPVLVLWDSKLLTPLAAISNIGGGNGESPSIATVTKNQGLLPRSYIHAPGAAKIAIINRSHDVIDILDTPLDEIRAAIPHRSETAIYKIPPSGLLRIPLDTPGLEDCTWEISEAPDGTTLEGKTLVWTKPPNMKLTHRSVRFALDAIFPSGMRTRLDLVGTPPLPENK